MKLNLKIRNAGMRQIIDVLEVTSRFVYTLSTLTLFRPTPILPTHSCLSFISDLLSALTCRELLKPNCC
jgi:hypothetical protein